jgi:hypothetical protein
MTMMIINFETSFIKMMNSIISLINLKPITMNNIFSSDSSILIKFKHR